MKNLNSQLSIMYFTKKKYDKIMTKDCAQNNVRNTTNLKEPQVPQIAQVYLRIVDSECQI